MSAVILRGVRITKEEYERILGSPYSSWLFESEGCPLTWERREKNFSPV